MAWRLHQTNDAIASVDIIQGEPDLLAVWSRRDRVTFYELETGIRQADSLLQFPETQDRTSDEWRVFITGLQAPNNQYLPLVRTPELTIYATGDGHIHLYETDDARLYLAIGEIGEGDQQTETRLDSGDADNLLAVSLDRALGITAVLDIQGRIHLYQQRTYAGTFTLDLPMTDESRPLLAVADRGEAIFVSNGYRIIRMDTTGAISHSIDVPYMIRQMMCAPNGCYLVTSDMDTGVIRLYDGRNLCQTHQRFAIDLLAEAIQVQLLADLPPAFVAPGALSVSNAGHIAFAMSGVICVSGIDQMTRLPALSSQEQTL